MLVYERHTTTLDLPLLDIGMTWWGEFGPQREGAGVGTWLIKLNRDRNKINFVSALAGRAKNKILPSTPLDLLVHRDVRVVLLEQLCDLVQIPRFGRVLQHPHPLHRRGWVVLLAPANGEVVAHQAQRPTGPNNAGEEILVGFFGIKPGSPECADPQFCPWGAGGKHPGPRSGSKASRRQPKQF